MSEGSARGSETILLVEDDPAVRAVARRGLTRYGYTVIPASCGEEALELAEKHAGGIDLLLTDIMMPGMNGVEVGAAMLLREPNLKIFYMSGYADQDLVRQGLLSPGSTFLQKPFTPQDLAQNIREVIDGSNPGSVSSGQRAEEA